MNIRQASYADKPALFEFLETAYSDSGQPKFKSPEHWAWAYETNPYLTGDAPPIWIAEAPDGRVVGQSAALVEPLIIEGKEYRVGWGGDFFVLPEHRGQGIGEKLQAAGSEGSEVFITLDMSQSAAAIRERLGLEPLPNVTVFERILHHEPETVRKTLQGRLPWLPPAAVNTLAPPIARMLTRRDRPQPPRPMPGLEIRHMTGFTEVFDRTWEFAGHKYRALVRRDARYLNWKFRDQPHTRPEIRAAFRAGEPVGWMILRRAQPPEQNTGIIVDLFTDPVDLPVAKALVAEAVRTFAEDGATVITAASIVPVHRQMLTRLGFKARRTITPLARASTPLPASGWLLGKGDYDWGQNPLA